MKFITKLFIKLEIYYQFTKKFFRKNKYFIPTFHFKKPKRNKVLIYNIKSKKFAEILFKKKNLTYYYADFRNLNLYIFFYTIKNSGLRNFKKNYKFNFFNSVKPKIIYTAMDNYLEFYLLKKIYPYATYISDQNAMRDEKFFETCKKFKNKNNLFNDLFFCFGENQKARLKEIFKSKYYITGNTINNNFKIKNSKSKIKKIIYISSGKYLDKELIPDINIFSSLKRFCDEKSLDLFFLDKPNRNRRKFFIKYFDYNLNYISSQNILQNYNLMKKDTLFVFTISTLGYEILSKGIRCVSLHHNQFNHRIKPYKSKGPFWIDTPDFNYNYNLIKNFLNSVLNYDQTKWNKIYKKFSKEILFYDQGNAIKKKIIKKYL